VDSDTGIGVSELVEVVRVEVCVPAGCEDTDAAPAEAAGSTMLRRAAVTTVARRRIGRLRD
jgi:hypothetical protein